MKFLKMMILSFSLLLLLPFLVVESSSLPDNDSVPNITRGSSLSLNDDTSSYWLSPSGNIAFGFYELPWSPGRYVVGIWFIKSPLQTLVWTANYNDIPLDNSSSSIRLTDEGKFMLRTMSDNKEKPLIPDLQEPVSYAKMNDDGNFVLYGSESQIVWESFDHPSDTILGGQKLKAGVDLISGGYKLSVRQSDGLVGIYDISTGEKVEMVSGWIDGTIYGPMTLNLDTTGNLYLQDVRYYYYLYKNKNQQHDEEGVHIYRATLDSRGYFDLYKERIDGNSDHNRKQSNTLARLWPKYEFHNFWKILVIVIGVIALLVGIIVLIAWNCE